MDNKDIEQIKDIKPFKDIEIFEWQKEIAKWNKSENREWNKSSDSLPMPFILYLLFFLVKFLDLFKGGEFEYH